MTGLVTPFTRFTLHLRTLQWHKDMPLSLETLQGKHFSAILPPSPLMFLEGCRLAYDTIAYNARPLLCDLLAFAFLLVLYAYSAPVLGCVVCRASLPYTDCICLWSSHHDIACFCFPSSALCIPVAYLMTSLVTPFTRFTLHLRTLQWHKDMPLSLETLQGKHFPAILTLPL